MLTATTTGSELMQVWFESEPDTARVQVAFPINRWTGSRDSAVVYFELEPGHRLPRHTDSAEEVLYIVAGELEAELGDERGRLAAGDLAVVPAMVPHGLVNTGDETARVVGFFAGAEVTSSFAEAIEPVGLSVVTQGAPVPAPA